jgi:KDO2-lipid IV(A) lauroyltransferase
LRKRIRYLLEAALFFALMGVFQLLGLERASAFGGWIARTLGPHIPLHKQARKRLRRAIPEKSEEEAQAILVAMWENLGRTVGEYPYLGRFRPFEPDSRIELIDFDILERIRERGCGAIFVSGHFANWELMPMIMREFRLKGATIYRAANNPYVDRYIVNLRKRHICREQIPKGASGVRDLVALMRAKGHIAMLVDQRMGQGVEVPFFGLPTMTPSAPAQLSLRHGIPIVPASIERIDGPRFRMRIFPPIEPQSTGDREADVKRIMTQVNQILEQCIRARPHEWLWLHRRWTK